MSESLILNSLLKTTTTENTLELIKNQQELLKKELQEQQLINRKFYQSIIDSGILKQITSSTSPNIIDSFQANHFTNNQNEYMPPTTLTNLISNNKNNGINSMLPFNDMFTGMGSVIEKLFGSKVWIYAFIALFIGVAFSMFACFCIYCCCCSRLGRLLCCFKCSSFSSSNNNKKKEANGKSKCCI